MQVDGKSFEVAEYSGKYSPELSTVYAKEARRACDSVVRQEYKGKKTQLHILAEKSSIGRKSTNDFKSGPEPTSGMQASTAGEFLHPVPDDGDHVPRVPDNALQHLDPA